MKTNKALLQLYGKSMIEVVYNKLSMLFENIYISTNKPGLYDFIPAEKIPDIYRSMGPMGGIHSCLTKTETRKNFFIACDLPLVSPEIIKTICNYPSDKNIVVPVIGDFKQYLCGVYDKNCYEKINSLITIPTKRNYGKNPNVSMKLLLSQSEYDLVPVEKSECYQTGMFINLNTKTEYNLVKYFYQEN